jgi:hypothetical protein
VTVVGKTPESGFEHTRAAIRTISDERLIQDFDDLLKGVEYAIERENTELGDLCVERLVTVAFTLSRTIGGDALVGIIQGLRQDIFDAGVALRPPIWQSGRRCVTNGQCESATNSSCYSDDTGCAGKPNAGGVFASYVWGIDLIQ